MSIFDSIRNFFGPAETTQDPARPNALSRGASLLGAIADPVGTASAVEGAARRTGPAKPVRDDGIDRPGDGAYYTQETGKVDNGALSDFLSSTGILPKPDPSGAVHPADFVRELPGTVLNTGAGILQSTARAIGRIGSLVSGQGGTIKAPTRAASIMTGLPQGTESTVEDQGRDLPFAKNASPVVAGVLGGASTLLDASMVDDLVKSGAVDTAKAAELLVKNGVPEKQAAESAADLAIKVADIHADPVLHPDPESSVRQTVSDHLVQSVADARNGTQATADEAGTAMKAAQDAELAKFRPPAGDVPPGGSAPILREATSSPVDAISNKDIDTNVNQTTGPSDVVAPKTASTVGSMIVGDKKLIDGLYGKSAELDSRIARNAERQPFVPNEEKGSVPRGADAILNRMRTETGLGMSAERQLQKGDMVKNLNSLLDKSSMQLPRHAVDEVSRFIDHVGEHMFDDVGMSIRKAGRARGQYDYAKNIVTIFKKNIIENGGEFSRTTIHELWHSLARYLPSEEVGSVTKQFGKELDSFTKKNPWFEEVSKNDFSFGEKEYEDFIKRNPSLENRFDKSYNPDSGKYSYKYIFSKEDYRFKNVDEWFAETLADKTESRFSQMDSAARGIFAHAKSIISDMIDSVHRIFGGDVAGRIFDKFHAGEMSTEIRNRYGLGNRINADVLLDEEKATGESGKVRQFTESAAKSSDLPAEAQTVAEEVGQADTIAAKSTAEMVGRAKQAVGDDLKGAEEFAKSGVSDEHVAVRNELLKKYGADMADQSLTEADRTATAAKFRETVTDQARAGTDTARALNAFRTINKATPEGIASDFIRGVEEAKLAGKDVKPVTDEQVSEIIRRGHEIEAMPEGLPKQQATNEYLKTLQKAVPSSVWDRITSVWKAGLLTGFATTGKNVLGNFFSGAAELVNQVPATGIDLLASLVRGTERTKSLGIDTTVGGFAKGFGEGLGKMMDYFRTGLDERDAAKTIDFTKVNFGDNRMGRALEAYTDAVHKVMGGTDMPFFYGARARSLYEQAYVAARKAGTAGGDLKAFVQDFVSKPPEEALVNATKDASFAVFQDETVFNKIATGIKNIPEAKRVAELVMPFTKTPASIAARILEYSPFGIVSTIKKSIEAGRFDQKLFSEALSRNLIGTGGLYYIGSNLFEKGKLTLGFPSDPKERAQLEAEGAMPDSVKIGDRWVPLIYFGPAGLSLVGGGYFRKGMDDTGSVSSAATQAFFGMGKTLTDQPMLAGPSEVLNAVNDPSQFGTKFAQSTIGSVLPTIVGNVAKTIDPSQKENTGIMSTLLGKIPGVRNLLPNKVDLFGNVPGSTNSPVDSFLFGTSHDTGEELLGEIAALEKQGQTVSLNKIGSTVAGIRLRPDEQNKYQIVYGSLLKEVLSQLVASDGYQSADGEGKAKAMSQAASQLQDAIRGSVLPYLLEKRYGIGNVQDPERFLTVMKALEKVPKFQSAPKDKQKVVIEALMGS